MYHGIGQILHTKPNLNQLNLNFRDSDLNNTKPWKSILETRNYETSLLITVQCWSLFSVGVALEMMTSLTIEVAVQINDAQK